ncbi:hypothetical protein GUITHDRAFT_92764 [Guillardia theta CCMP2712]|uniref:RING-type E3 ubiquitin transferase n=2 Tax=Guillardia theta TaxID=55529 RepID=L1JRR4_GUITC|nr:hypothetical protein GUITHDRAFT_92764 [Guillardia theta CCMP2712]EKX51256.1 hypothetical protein GUITHDRAFT_92764 [Guillardia theta CCMP2712]|eukprot:XP_005838236.1 hypothetical protein GUITHDRAFT_92764 [Guillardia theta CCMP2712]
MSYERLLELDNSVKKLGLKAHQLERLSNIAKRLRDLEGRKEGDCCICLEKVEANLEGWQLPCRHFFHEGCIRPWLRTNTCCPFCRACLTRI